MLLGQINSVLTTVTTFIQSGLFCLILAILTPMVLIVVLELIIYINYCLAACGYRFIQDLAAVKVSTKLRIKYLLDESK